MTALLLAFLSAAGPSAAGAVMVLPPGEVDGTENMWVGETVADALPRELARLGVPVIDRADRLRAHELLAIPVVALTRATSIRMAEALGVARIVEGSFEAKGKSLSLSLRLLDVVRGTLSAPLIATGPIESLPSLVRSLAWDVALSGPTPPRTTREAFLAYDTRPAPPLEIQRAYGQALSTRDPAARRRLLRKTLVAWPAFDEGRVALGRFELEARDSAAALEALARVPPTSPLSRSARFLEGRAELDLGRYSDAAKIYASLVNESQTPGVLNNYGLALLRLGAARNGEHPSDILRKAVDLEPRFLEPPFNLGWALFTEGDADGATAWMRRVLGEDPRDTHARLVLVWSLRQAGHNDEADAEWKQLLAVAPSYENLAAPDLGRRFERVMASENPPLLDQDREAGAR